MKNIFPSITEDNIITYFDFPLFQDLKIDTNSESTSVFLLIYRLNRKKNMRGFFHILNKSILMVYNRKLPTQENLKL